MSLIVAAAIAATACGLLAWLVLVPAAKLIPARLDEHWLNQAREALQYADKSQEVAYALSTWQKALLVLATVCVGLVVTWRYGPTVQALGLGSYFLALLLLAAINLKHSMLPDSIVFAVLWAGLLLHASAGSASAAIFGAAACYGVLFLINVVFNWMSHRDALAGGDLKALAMAGAWFGVGAVSTILWAFFGGLVVWAIVTRLAGHKGPRALPTGVGHLTASLVPAFGTGGEGVLDALSALASASWLP